MKAARVKQHNNPSALSAKVQLRLNVLEVVRPARVLDGFCGRGVMFRGVWHQAAEYVGCDQSPWSPGDPVRFVCDNRRLLRCLELQAFNVFDFDAFGSPWEQVYLLAARRRWARGELGGLVITDGSSLKTRFGELPHAMVPLVGMSTARIGATTAGSEELRRLALQGFARRAGVRIVREWEAVGPPPCCVYYAAIVFEGA